MIRCLVVSLLVAFAPSAAQAADFSFTFTWAGLKSCNTGKPNVVGNPAFVLKGVPKGTTQVEFTLKDLDVPSYRHGGGVIPVTKDGKVAAGAFTYKSPCPPKAVHRYQWTAVAKAGKGGKTLATATAIRSYPE